MSVRANLQAAVVIALLVSTGLAAGCGGGGRAPTYRLGGTVTGFEGTGLVLATPGEPTLVVPDGATTFTFADGLPSGTAYQVTVLRQPTAPAEDCTVTGGTGTVASADVTSVAVACVLRPEMEGPAQAR